jgi:hypothetical protein
MPLVFDAVKRDVAKSLKNERGGPGKTKIQDWLRDTAITYLGTSYG